MGSNVSLEAALTNSTPIGQFTCQILENMEATQTPRTGPAMGRPPTRRAKWPSPASSARRSSGTTSLSSAPLVAITGSLYSVAAFVIVIAMVSFACSYLMTETLRSRTPSFSNSRQGCSRSFLRVPCGFQCGGILGNVYASASAFDQLVALVSSDLFHSLTHANTRF